MNEKQKAALAKLQGAAAPGAGMAALSPEQLAAVVGALVAAQAAQAAPVHSAQAEPLGPDPEVVRRHQEFLRTYKPAPAEVEIAAFKLPSRDAEYLDAYAVARGRTRAEAIKLMVRETRAKDVHWAAAQGGGSGPRELYQAQASQVGQHVWRP